MTGEPDYDSERLHQRIVEMHREIPDGLLATESLFRERRIEAYRELVESGVPVEEAERLYAEWIAELERQRFSS